MSTAVCTHNTLPAFLQFGNDVSLPAFIIQWIILIWLTATIAFAIVFTVTYLVRKLEDKTTNRLEGQQWSGH